MRSKLIKSKWWHRYHEYFFEQTGPLNLVLFRIFLGLLVIYVVLDWQPALLFWLENPGHKYPSEFVSDLILGFLNVSNPVHCVYILSSLAIGSAAMVTVGFATRIHCGICFLALMALRRLYPPVVNNADALIANLLLFLALSPAGRYFGIDAVINRSKTQYPVWPLRLLQWQIGALYISTAIRKFASPAWREGSSVYYTTRAWAYMYGWVGLPEIFDNKWLLQLLAWGIPCLELTLGVLLPIGYFRWPLIILGVSFHFGLFITMSSITRIWQLVMIGSYLLFLPTRSSGRKGRIANS